MIRIKTITMKSMGKTLHAEFHSVIVGAVARRGGADAIGLEPTTMEAYVATVAEVHAHIARQGKSGITRQLAALDGQRDELVGAILTRLRYVETWPGAEVQAAAEEVQRLITDGYTLSLKRLPMQRKSTLITALLVDLKKLDAGVLATLGVEVLASELQRVNEAHGQAYLARHRERVEQGVGVVQRLRREVDELYRRVCLDAAYWANRTDEALAAVSDAAERERLSARREAARRFVGDLNRHIVHYKHYYFGRERDEEATSDTEEGAQ